MSARVAGELVVSFDRLTAGRPAGAFSVCASLPIISMTRIAPFQDSKTSSMSAVSAQPPVVAFTIPRHQLVRQGFSVRQD